MPSAEFFVADSGTGIRTSVYRLGSAGRVHVTHVGLRSGLRIFHSGNFHLLEILLKLPNIIQNRNEIFRLIKSVDVVLDISGGDSFSDIYGQKRFYEISVIKSIALKLKKKLILLPQTFGPYQQEKNRDVAEQIVKNASMCFARDKHSFDNLVDLLGPVFDSSLHKEGVDVAFALPAREPGGLEKIKEEICEGSASGIPKIGINISGLVYQDPQGATKKFGFKARYNEVLKNFVEWVLKETNAHVFLVSHVLAPEGHYESDWGAARQFLKDNNLTECSRITVFPNNITCEEVKWLIAKMNWFCGMRMHSTIASLSMGVPTCSIAYSDKTKGVFATCSQQDYVFDPRYQNEVEIFEALKSAYLDREQIRQHLEKSIVEVINKSRMQFDEIVTALSR